MNTDSDIIDIFTVVNPSLHPNDHAGLHSTGFTFVETGTDIGVNYVDYTDAAR